MLDYFQQVYYIATSRELKRLDSLALSPIFGNFNESLQGLLTLRAFRKQDQFTERNHALLDKSNRCWWPIQVVNRYPAKARKAVDADFLGFLMLKAWFERLTHAQQLLYTCIARQLL